MINVHDNENAPNEDAVAKYAGAIAIIAIVALVGIRVLMERK